MKNWNIHDIIGKAITATVIIMFVVIGSGIIYTAIMSPDDNNNDYEYLSDGTIVRKVEIDGHLYLKTDKTITHSESCKNPTHPQNQ